MNIGEIKAYKEKVSAQLQEAKAVLEALEGHAKSKLAQSEIDAIRQLKTKSAEIHHKIDRDLTVAAAAAVATKLKSEIDAEVAKFKSSVGHLSAKIKGETAGKAAQIAS